MWLHESLVTKSDYVYSIVAVCDSIVTKSDYDSILAKCDFIYYN